MDLEKIISESIQNIGYELVECEHNHNSGLIRIFIDNGNLISVDDVTDGLNLMQGKLDLVSGELNIEVHQVD